VAVTFTGTDDCLGGKAASPRGGGEPRPEFGVYGYEQDLE